MIKVEQISKEIWKEHFASEAHKVVFNELWDKEFERIDFALLTADEKDMLVQFATIRELDRDSAYIQYGGAFPNYRGTIKSFESFTAILDWLSSRYTNIGFLTENDNFPMLKFAIKKEFRIVGMRVYKNHVMLEHFKTRKAD